MRANDGEVLVEGVGRDGRKGREVVQGQRDAHNLLSLVIMAIN